MLPLFRAVVKFCSTNIAAFELDGVSIRILYYLEIVCSTNRLFNYKSLHLMTLEIIGIADIQSDSSYHTLDGIVQCIWLFAEGDIASHTHDFCITCRN